jgi:hypothetical protein
MQDRRQIEVERQSIALQQQSDVLKNNNNKKNLIFLDPLLDQTPEMGVEGLIATIDDRAKLLEALRRNIQKNKHRITNHRKYI